MLLAAILLLHPLPQIGNAAKLAGRRSAMVSSRSTDDSSLSEPLPWAPEPKVKTDLEAADGPDSVARENVPALAYAAVPIGPRSAPMPLAAVKPVVKRTPETAGQRKLWYALVFAGSGAAGFDAWSTRRAIAGGYGTEGNPLLRPFSHSGAMYAATQVSPVLMDFIGRRMMVSQHKLIRRMWWLPQAAGSGVSVAAGVHNLRLVP
jgi:hypothetical protein